VIAAGKSIDVVVRPDPATCAATVIQLAALADVCGRAEEMLGRHAHLGEEELGGMSGIVYRHSTTLLRRASHRIGARSRRLADGLSTYAAEMTEVHRLMDEAVAIASPHLLVGGGRIFSPAEPARPDDTVLEQAWSAWHEAVAHWRAGRRLEEQTSQEWLRVVSRGVVIDDGDPPTLDLPLDPPFVGGVR
jgi:hypothetical protein